MARKHVVNYYIEQQSSYMQMLEDVAELEKIYKEGKMSYEKYSDLRERLLPQIEELKAPYELLSYVIFLLNIPNRPKKDKKYLAQNKMYFAYLDKYSKENMIKESDDVLKKFKQIVKDSLKEIQ